MISPYVAPGIKQSDMPLRKIDPMIIISTICAYTGIKYSVLQKKDRRRPLVYTRQLCMHFLRAKTNLSLREVGEYFGGFDHTSVIHAVTRLHELMEFDEVTKKDIEHLNQII